MVTLRLVRAGGGRWLEGASSSNVTWNNWRCGSCAYEPRLMVRERIAYRSFVWKWSGVVCSFWIFDVSSSSFLSVSLLFLFFFWSNCTSSVVVSRFREDDMDDTDDDAFPPPRGFGWWWWLDRRSVMVRVVIGVGSFSFDGSTTSMFVGGENTVRVTSVASSFGGWLSSWCGISVVTVLTGVSVVATVAASVSMVVVYFDDAKRVHNRGRDVTFPLLGIQQLFFVVAPMLLWIRPANTVE